MTGTELRGGRWLRMDITVLDVSTLRLYKTDPFIDAGSSSPFAGLQAGNSRAVAFSPRQTQYVAHAEGIEYKREGQPRYSALMVVDIPNATAYALKLSRKDTHFFHYRDLTPAWLAHYFQWTKNAQSVEKLSPRPDAKILRWIGRIKTREDGYAEYNVAPVSEAIIPVVARFMTEHMSAAPEPD